jgi:hypothetical protein
MNQKINKELSAGTAAQQSFKRSWLIRHALLLAILMLSAVSCNRVYYEKIGAEGIVCLTTQKQPEIQSYSWKGQKLYYYEIYYKGNGSAGTLYDTINWISIRERILNEIKKPIKIIKPCYCR